MQVERPHDVETTSGVLDLRLAYSHRRHQLISSTKSSRCYKVYVLPSRTPPSHSHNKVIEKDASYIQEDSIFGATALPEEGMATRYRDTRSHE